MILTKPVPHKEAAAAIRSKPVVSRAVFAEMLPELRALAFTITITEELKTAAALRQFHAELAKVREALATLPEGRDYEEVKAEILGRLSPYFKNEAAARNRAELLLRLHGGQAYAAAQFRVLDRQRDVFPYWKYVSFGDDRVRATHRALNQKIFPADSPFWERHFPPWEFMCRCRVVGITQGEADRIREREKDLPLAKRTLMEGAALNLAVNQNKLASPEDDGTQYDLTTPSERDPDGYRWHPGQIGQGLDGLRRQVDPAQWGAFEAKAKRVRIGGGRSLWDALEKGQGAAARAQSQGRPLAILTPEKRAAVLKALGMTEADLAAWRAKELAPRTPYPAPTPAAPAAPAVAPAATGRLKPAGTAVSNAADLTGTKAGDLAPISAALAAVDAVHGDGPLPRIPFLGGWKAKHSMAAYLRYKASDAPHSIQFRKRGGQARAEFNLLHEIGHFIDHRGLHSGRDYATESHAKMKPLVDLLEKSAARARLLAGPFALGWKNYAVKPIEMVARAYAQWIAIESGRPEWVPADWIQTGVQWESADFAPIAAEFRRLFQAEGWMKP